MVWATSDEIIFYPTASSSVTTDHKKVQHSVSFVMQDFKGIQKKKNHFWVGGSTGVDLLGKYSTT
jgi:hypothetical protein